MNKSFFTLIIFLLFKSLSLVAQTTDVVTDLSNPTGLAFKGNELYFAERNVGIVSKIDVTDPNPVVTEVISGLAAPNYLIINGNDLYIAEFDENRISKIDITDPSPSAETVVSGLEGPEVLLLNEDDLYIAEFDGNKISKINITDANPTRTDVLTTGLSFPSGLSLHGNDLYVSSNNGKIVKTDISQNTPSLTEVIALSSPADLVLCGNDLYIAEFGGSRISKIDITETSPTATTVVPGLFSPSRIIKIDDILYFNSSNSKIVKFELPPTTIWDGDDLSFTKASNADWSLQANQDRITDDVWITRQNNRPIYNYKWWQETYSTDASGDDLQYEFQGDGGDHTPTQSFTATGGTKGLRWAILDNTGATNTQNWEAFSFYGTLGSPTHFYSFNNVVTMISLLERGEEVTINSVADNFIVNNTSAEGTFDTNGPSSDFHEIVGKNLGVWIEEENIYFTLTFNSWVSGGGGDFSYTRSTASTLSIDKPLPTQSRVILLPNPVRNQLQLFGLSHSQTYTIYNLLGVESGQGKIDDGGAVPVSDLPKGLYFIKLENGQALKFVKE